MMKKARIVSFLLAFTVIFSQGIALAAPSASPSPSASPIPSASPNPSATPAAPKSSSAPSAAPDASAAPDDSAAQDKKTFPEPRAKAALLYDLKGGRTIYQSNTDERIYPASATKIMTALLALEKGNLGDTLTVSESALADINYMHSRIDLKTGEQMPLEDLLTALLVSSANDAANVIAEHIAGSIPAFVEMMNTRAKELGMTNTNFVNPHGFHDENHYTTANDLMLLTREALKNTKFCELVKIKTISLAATNSAKARNLSTTNHLISRFRNTYHYYSYATGVNAGSSAEAGSCLIATAEKNGISLLSVVMGCENENQNEGAYSFVDTRAMFEYVFENYKSVNIAATTEIVSDSKVYEAKDNTRVALSPSKDIIMLLPADYTAEDITKQFSLPEQINAPIEKGSQLGTATYAFRGQTIATVDLLAANDVKRDGIVHFLHSVSRVIFSPYLLIPLFALAALLVMNALNQSKKRKARRRKMKSQHVQRNGYNSRSYSAANRSRNAARRPQGSRPPQGRRPQQRRPSGSSSARSNYRSGSRPTNTRPPSSTRPRQPRTPDPWDKYR